MNNTTFVPEPLKLFRRAMAVNGVIQHINQNGGRTAPGGYACLVSPDGEVMMQHITMVVPLQKKNEWKKLKKKWRKDDIGGSYFYITAEDYLK